MNNQLLKLALLIGALITKKTRNIKKRNIEKKFGVKLKDDSMNNNDFEEILRQINII